MTETTAVSRDELKGIFDISTLKDQVYKVTIAPITKAEAEELEFKTLKGIAGKPLSLEEVRRERLGL